MTTRRKPAPPAAIRSRRNRADEEQSQLIDLSAVVSERPPEGMTWTEFEALSEPEVEVSDEEVTEKLDERKREHSWDEVDVKTKLLNKIPPEVLPTLVQRNDGEYLLYRGKISSVAGPPESAKGWFACEAARQVLNGQEHVYYIDFEDSPEAILRRMLQLHVPPVYLAQFFHVINPEEKFDTHGPTGTKLWKMLIRDMPGLVILDGLTQALANNDMDDNKNTDVVQWFRDLPRRIVRFSSGNAAVLIVDHVTKADDASKRYALGAGQKLAALDGSQFKAQLVKPFAPGKSGRMTIRVTKDRPGGVRAKSWGDSVEAGQVACSMELKSIDGPEHFVEITLWPANQKVRLTPDEQIVPVKVMAEMMKIISSPGQQPPNRSQLKGLVKGNSAAKVIAVNELLKDGQLIERKEDFDTGPLKLYVNPHYNPIKLVNDQEL